MKVKYFYKEKTKSGEISETNKTFLSSYKDKEMIVVFGFINWIYFTSTII